MLEIPFFISTNANVTRVCCVRFNIKHSLVLMYIDYCGATYIRLKQWGSFTFNNGDHISFLRLQTDLKAAVSSGTSILNWSPYEWISSSKHSAGSVNHNLSFTACYFFKCDHQIPKGSYCGPALQTFLSKW